MFGLKSWKGIGGLKFDGKQTVYRRPIGRKDFHQQFTVLEKNKVAEYDENILKDSWNSLIRPPWRKRISNYWKHGLLAQTFPIIALFLCCYYLLFLLISNICATKCDNVANKFKEDESEQNNNEFLEFLHYTFQDRITNQSMFCASNKHQNQIDGQNLNTLIEAEYHMTRISTLLIGFFVAFTIRTYSSYTIRFLPTVNSFCIAMGSLLSVKKGANEDELLIDFGNRKLSLKQFKKDITRYYFLSWAMCFCRISPPLMRSFPNPGSFNKKKLLTKLEYNKLKVSELRTDNDCWLENWPMPLFWINKMICSIGKGAKAIDKEGNVVEDVKFGETKELGIAIFKTKDQLEILSKQHHYGPPDLMLQCITLAIYSVIFLGTIAAQPTISCSEERFVTKLIGAFPLFYCVKYILLIGWLKTAKHLQNPFGEDA